MGCRVPGLWRFLMRGKAARQATMLTAVTPDDLVPQGHPIRRIKPMVDRALAQLSPAFARMYAQNGRASIPPEHLLKACLLMALFSVRSERQFCERLEYDLPFKWFLDLNIPEPPVPELRPLGIRQEPATAAGRRRGPGVPAPDSGAGPQAATAVGGTLQRGWDAIGGVGVGEEFPTPGR